MQQVPIAKSQPICSQKNTQVRVQLLWQSATVSVLHVVLVSDILKTSLIFCSLRCLIYFIFHCCRAVYLHVDSIADEFATYIAITPACLPHGSPTVKVHNEI